MFLSTSLFFHSHLYPSSGHNLLSFTQLTFICSCWRRRLSLFSVLSLHLHSIFFLSFFPSFFLSFFPFCLHSIHPGKLSKDCRHQKNLTLSTKTIRTQHHASYLRPTRSPLFLPSLPGINSPKSSAPVAASTPSANTSLLSISSPTYPEPFRLAMLLVQTGVPFLRGPKSLSALLT